MTQARAVLVAFRGPARRRRFDLALALALLGNAVRGHERAERNGVGPLGSRPHALAGCEHAKPLGA